MGAPRSPEIMVLFECQLPPSKVEDSPPLKLGPELPLDLWWLDPVEQLYGHLFLRRGGLTWTSVEDEG